MYSLAGGRRRNGFSLIELLVVAGVIGILVSLTLPAVEAAREAARRAACLSNLRGLCVAACVYSESHGVYPTGYLPTRDPRLAVAAGFCETGRGAASVFVRILPCLDEVRAADFNYDVAPFLSENQTVCASSLAFLVCPSDPAATEPGGRGASGLLKAARTSYAANAGALCLLDLATRLPDCSPGPQFREQDSGVFPHRSWLRPAHVVDGLSHTMMFSERAVALSAYKTPNEQWWVEGGFIHTLFSASAPPNFRGFLDRALTLRDGFGALSMHPGGVVVALCDGSAMFVGDSVGSWRHDEATGGPSGAFGDSATGWSNIPERGIWQALATRAGNDGPGEL